MTGQILAGEDPSVASRYQLVMMFLIASSTGVATVLAVLFSLLLLFDKQARVHPPRPPRLRRRALGY
jgi:putative ABC transport system permease protein